MKILIFEHRAGSGSPKIGPSGRAGNFDTRPITNLHTMVLYFSVYREYSKANLTKKGTLREN